MTLVLSEKPTLEVPIDEVGCALCGKPFELGQPVMTSVDPAEAEMKLRVWIVHEACILEARKSQLSKALETVMSAVGECQCSACKAEREGRTVN